MRNHQVLLLALLLTDETDTEFVEEREMHSSDPSENQCNFQNMHRILKSKENL